jgi:hypothetical protein
VGILQGSVGIGENKTDRKKADPSAASERQSGKEKPRRSRTRAGTGVPCPYGAACLPQAGCATARNCCLRRKARKGYSLFAGFDFGRSSRGVVVGCTVG